MSARSQFLATTGGTENKAAAGDYLLNTLNLAVAGSASYDAGTAKLVEDTMALAKDIGADRRFSAHVAQNMPVYASLVTPAETVAETKAAPVARTIVKMGSGM